MAGAWKGKGGGTEKYKEYLWQQLQASDCSILGTDKLSLGSPPSQGVA